LDDSSELDGSIDKLLVVSISISTGMVASVPERDLLNLFLGGSFGGTCVESDPAEGTIKLPSSSAGNLLVSSTVSKFEVDGLESSPLVLVEF
jgi:hypothetical protein